MAAALLPSTPVVPAPNHAVVVRLSNVQSFDVTSYVATELEMPRPTIRCWRCRPRKRDYAAVGMSVEVIYDTFTKTTTRAAHGGSLMEGVRLSTLKQDGHSSLRGSGHRSVIPYIHGRKSVVLLCVPLFKAELFT
jgi:hypothetical protein